MSITKAIAGIRRAATNVGDTIQAIALRETGEMSRWYDLVQLNNLLPPYLTDKLELAGPRVLLAGQQTIRIPAAAPPPTGVADTETVFGTDLRLDGGRLDATPGGDLLTVSGAPNLTQALRNRLVTHPGDLGYHPRYGCDVHKLVGRGGTSTTDQLAVAFVARAIRSDARIARVEGAVGGLVGDTINISATAVSVDGKRLPAGLITGAPGAPAQG